MVERPMESMPTKRFSVIDGGASPPSEWLDFRSLVLARWALAPDQSVFYRFSKRDIEKSLAARRRQPILDAWSMIFGETPPVPNISRWTGEFSGKRLVTLRDATACFRGLKRPMADDDTGFNVVAYVSKPALYFRATHDMVCVAKPQPFPADLVFVTYVRLDHPVKSDIGLCGFGEGATKGVVTHWEVVEADPTDPHLPVQHRDRYRKRLW
ncbi:hypothetical protein MWN33_12195 [Starkeya koreensis]|uniref:PAS domain-containing protein n=1 Tax=Ancylobacter koreensis TaxID=266121 RepID=A0ABT0DNF0_9HYPH|nr:hypothetical protein [Ancylobacter koreensis]MCK0208790.1 hypothetical protein [Ancylobacter koreensis]